MKKITKVILFLSFLLILSGCSTYKELRTSEDGTKRTIATEQAGELEISSEIHQPVMFRSADPLNAYLLGVKPVGIHEVLKENELINEKLPHAEFVKPGDIDTVDSLNPDVIVTYAPDEYASQYKEIAPTIEMRYITGRLSPYKHRVYLTHFYYMGVILNKEQEAKEKADAWLESIPKFRSKLNEQVTDKNAVVLMEGKENMFYFQPEYSSYGTEAVFDVLGFNQTKSVKRMLEEKDRSVDFDDNYEDVKADYVFVSTENINNDTLKQKVSKCFKINENQVVLVNQDDFRPNDIMSIEKQTNTIIKELNEK